MPDMPHIEGNKLTRFTVSGLFGSLRHDIHFPRQPTEPGGPSIAILAGPNGVGKTTILHMIEGMLKLDFNPFRRVPFSEAILEVEGAPPLTVRSRDDPQFPLLVKFGDTETVLSRNKDGPYTTDQEATVTEFRANASLALRTINYELLDIHRSVLLRETHRGDILADFRSDTDEALIRNVRAIAGRTGKLLSRSTRNVDSNVMAARVRSFIRDAQINYRRFFSAGELELLPRLVSYLRSVRDKKPTREQLLAKIDSLSASNERLRSIGLETEQQDIFRVRELFSSSEIYNNEASLIVLNSYLDLLENRNKQRELIAERLRQFEAIMSNFYSSKIVRIDPDIGLTILTMDGKELQETDLSSGEYRLLYMMVTALIANRSGTIIAIDEPELSLHVTWQRRLISALVRCAAGASPLFILATHSAAISAEYEDRVFYLHFRK